MQQGQQQSITKLSAYSVTEKGQELLDYALACQEMFSLCNKSQGKGVNTFLNSVYNTIKHTIKCT